MADQGLLDFLHEYVDQLSELTSPIKSKINSLSMLAAEEAVATPTAAPSIAAAIEKRISTAPPTAKLPALFLLDSIAKNAKQPFIQIFSRNLPQVFSTVWDACPTDRKTLQRVLATWDGIFPAPAVDVIRSRCGLAPTLATHSVGAPQQGAAMLAPMQRDSASQLHQQRPHQGELARYTPPQPPLQQGDGSAADPYAALRAAAAARLAALQQPRPQQQQHRQQHQQQAVGGAPGGQQNGVATASQNWVMPNRGREYQPDLAGLPGGTLQLPPHQVAELQALLQSLSQGGGSAAPARTAAAPSVDELWSQAVLKDRRDSVVRALLDASAGTLAGQLDRAFAAKRRARARGGAQQSRPWFPRASAWLRGLTVEVNPGAAFGQQEDAEREAPQMESVSSDDTQTACALSGEKFETFWDDGQQQWRYRDARRLDAVEAARYSLPEGVIVLVSALGAPAADGDAAADEPDAAAPEAAGGAGGTPSEVGIGAETKPETAAAAADGGQPGGPAFAEQPPADLAGAVKAEAAEPLPSGAVLAADTAETATEMAPAAVGTAAAPLGAAVEDGADAVHARPVAKRRLDAGSNAEGPPLVKVKREPA